MSSAFPYNLLFESFWRAVVYCLRFRVIALSFLPLLLSLLVLGLLRHFFWRDAVQFMAYAFAQWGGLQDWLAVLSQWGWHHASEWLASFLLLLLVVPAAVVLCLLLVALFMVPAVVRLVAEKRFAGLQSHHQVAWWQALGWSLGASVVASVLWVMSLPLWAFPLFAFTLPHLIWGWLTYRVMAFDTLAGYATPEERRHLMRAHRWPLVTIGVVCGLLGAAPTMLWALSAMTLVLAPLMLFFSLWLYTWTFAFASLWFAHYLLPSLHELRARA